MMRRELRCGMMDRALGRGMIIIAVLWAASDVRAQVTSDEAAAILVFPKILVDTSNIAGRGRIDTLIRISNTDPALPVSMKCFWVNANGHCSNSSSSGGTICDPYLPHDPRCDANSSCVAGWQETDFFVTITARQPVAWLASRGAVPCEASSDPVVPCFGLPGSGHPGPSSNAGSRVSPVPEDPFIGELKCLAVDLTNVPVERNVLQGEAEITRSNTGLLDVEGYNAVGVPAIPGTNNFDSTLVLGGFSAEYSACPNILILDHFFDGASDPVSGATVTTDLTLVPCSEDFLNQRPVTTPVQFLVFNEFEQRFSTSKSVTCFRELHISNIDTQAADHSIFSAGVMGTLTGQTRIRGVVDPNDNTHGHTLLGVAEEFRNGAGSAAFNLHYQGSRPQSDFIYLPPE